MIYGLGYFSQVCKDKHNLYLTNYLNSYGDKVIITHFYDKTKGPILLPDLFKNYPDTICVGQVFRTY